MVSSTQTRPLGALDGESRFSLAETRKSEPSLLHDWLNLSYILYKPILVVNIYILSVATKLSRHEDTELDSRNHTRLTYQTVFGLV